MLLRLLIRWSRRFRRMHGQIDDGGMKYQPLTLDMPLIERGTI